MENQQLTEQTKDYSTIVFDSASEYIRFIDHVYAEFDGAGLAFTNIPVILSVRVLPRLLEKT